MRAAYADDRMLDTIRDMVSAVSNPNREAEEIDRCVVACFGRVRTSSIELGDALVQMKSRKVYRTLGFQWFQHYVEARGMSISYAERVMRASRAAAGDKSMIGLSVDQILFVVNVSSREGSGKTKKQWAEFARESSYDERSATKKQLTRAGILPVNPTGREQAIKNAPIEASVDMTIRISGRGKRMFQELCERWALSSGATLIKLLMIEQAQR